MAKKKSSKRDDDLFTKLRESGMRKNVADQIARASAGLDSGKKKAEKGVRDATENIRALLSELESRLPIGEDKKADARSVGAGARATASKASASAGGTARKAKSTSRATSRRAKASVSLDSK